jgi:hypothetical protein
VETWSRRSTDLHLAATVLGLIQSVLLFWSLSLLLDISRSFPTTYLLEYIINGGEWYGDPTMS